MFFKLVDETQMSKPPEAASYRNSTKLLTLLPLRAIYFYSLFLPGNSGNNPSSFQRRRREVKIGSRGHFGAA